ncbi:MAG: AgmX/PglI C-terminal domain-containing protein [Kofleriaceae bacterium]
MASVQPRSRNSDQPSRAPRRRILRVGILLNRTLVEERQMNELTDITIGQSAKNTFSIPLENMPRQFPIFSVEKTPEGPKYRLNFMKGMDGRISDGGQPLRLDDLKSRAENKGDHWSWPLPETTRGKIEMGDFTLLFQFVTEPPKAPKPMLPASVRGTFADRIDPRLSAIVAMSILLHFSVAIYARIFHDPEVDGGMIGLATKQVFRPEETTIELLEPPTPEDSGSAAGSAAADAPKAPDKTPDKPKNGGDDKPDKPSTSPDTGGGRDVTDAVALNEEAMRYVDMLAGEDLAGGGVLGDMDKRKPGSDLGKQVSDVRSSGANVQVGGGSTSGTRGNGDPRVGTGKGTGVGTGTVDTGTGKTDKEPAGRISVGSKSGGDDSTLTPDAVLKRIMDIYMSGLKRCYKDYLKVDPTARGKVSLSFTVNEKGRSVSNKAAGFAGEVDSCIEARMGGWTFPVPKDGDGDPTDAQFKIALQLVPD